MMAKGGFRAGIFVKSLQFRVAVGVLSALAFALGGASYLHMRLLEQRRLKALETETAVLGSSLEGALELAMLGERRDELQATLQRVSQGSEIVRVFILNNRGEVKLTSDSSQFGARYKPGEGKCAYCHVSGKQDIAPAAAAFKRGEASFWSARPIYNQPRCQQCHSMKDRVNGMLVVERSLAGFTQEIIQEKKELARLSLGGFAAAALILIPLLHILVVSRLRRVSGQASRIHGNDLDHPLSVKGNDEVAALGLALENMRVRLLASLREVQEGKAYLEEIMDGVHEGMLVIDRELRVQRVNQAWCDLTGKKAEAILGQPCWLLCSQEGAPPHDCPARRCFQKGEEGWAIHTVTDTHGQVRHLEVHCTPLRNEQNEIFEVVEVTRDISSRKELESRLLHAERLTSVGRLAAGVAHEINNPMASIAASAEGLQRRFRAVRAGESLPTSEEVDEYLDTIRRASRRCREITSKLLDFARKDASHRKCVHVNRLVEDASALLRQSIRSGCHLQTKLDPNLPSIVGAPGELTQLIFNLLLNAADAVGEEGEIQVITSRQGDSILLQVLDTGPGIPESELSQIFDPFYTTKPPGVGSGLGLFVCKGTVDRHHGDISLENRPEGGIKVVVTIPVNPLTDDSSFNENDGAEGL